jgi:hypothetical protein
MVEAGDIFLSDALINDPDAHGESSIPWNKPAKWENGANVPGGINAGGMGGINN